MHSQFVRKGLNDEEEVHDLLQQVLDSESSISASSMLSSTDQTGATDTNMEVEDVASDMLGI